MAEDELDLLVAMNGQKGRDRKEEWGRMTRCRSVQQAPRDFAAIPMHLVPHLLCTVAISRAGRMAHVLIGALCLLCCAYLLFCVHRGGEAVDSRP